MRQLNTNAHQHVVAFKRGVWRTALERERCSRFFGKTPRCLGAIRKGHRYFDTQLGGKHVCLGCAISEPQGAPTLAMKAA